VLGVPAKFRARCRLLRARGYPRVGPLRVLSKRRHVDLAGNEFPFSRGVSFYEVNAEGKIVSARDCVEPAIKPGASALQVPPTPLLPAMFLI
jgi:hypothetical protein